LSLTIICAGIALAMGKVWPLVLVVLPWAAMNWVVIPFEESRLRKAFGQDYSAIAKGFGAGREAALLARSLTRDLGAGPSAVLLTAPIARWRRHF
jgi:Phospholipid methyltransferase